MKPSFLFLFALLTSGSFAEPVALAPDAIVQQFCAAARQQERVLSGASMEVEISASLPKLKKEGTLHALRKISALGRITYERLKFEGDGTVKNNVIARYLTAEAQSQSDESPSLAVTPENYNFHYKGRAVMDSRPVHVFQVTPRKKRVGLFRGEIWVDAETYLRVQESGCFVKNPSFFLKRVAFVRKYEIRDGVSIPRHLQSVVDTRLVGKAQLDIEYSHFALDSPRGVSAAEAEGQ